MIVIFRRVMHFISPQLSVSLHKADASMPASLLLWCHISLFRFVSWFKKLIRYFIYSFHTMTHAQYVPFSTLTIFARAYGPQHIRWHWEPWFSHIYFARWRRLWYIDFKKPFFIFIAFYYYALLLRARKFSLALIRFNAIIRFIDLPERIRDAIHISYAV